ncbi:MAG: hypothetical protein HY730_08790 [Candidatus Tectomicrobia bacterium]|uniref:Uncharacterized protein n=1 Tax=Tectimicrobiota bacterium TaxID=2528274 RepID=A0A933GNN6_UNCTE|nr:hypothetical protein [Candidatus Tectomicrobia bacterium]
MEKSKKLKDMSIYEASDFWDEHDFTEFQDVQETQNIRFSLKKKKYVGVEMEIYEKVKKRAKRLHKTEEDLINEWLSQKVEA